jgi:hypothetical protein
MKYIIFSTVIIIANLLINTNCLFFKLEEDKEKCFVDELYKGSVIIFLK